MKSILTLCLAFCIVYFFASTGCNQKNGEVAPVSAKMPAPQGDVTTLYIKGKRLYDAKKFKEASPYLHKAARMGHSDAQMHLGKMYFNGWGVGHSHGTARIWHEKAAKQGNKESIKKLKKFQH